MAAVIPRADLHPSSQGFDSFLNRAAALILQDRADFQRKAGRAHSKHRSLLKVSAKRRAKASLEPNACKQLPDQDRLLQSIEKSDSFESAAGRKEQPNVRSSAASNSIGDNDTALSVPPPTEAIPILTSHSRSKAQTHDLPELLGNTVPTHLKEPLPTTQAPLHFPGAHDRFTVAQNASRDGRSINIKDTLIPNPLHQALYVASQLHEVRTQQAKTYGQQDFRSSQKISLLKAKFKLQPNGQNGQDEQSAKVAALRESNESDDEGLDRLDHEILNIAYGSNVTNKRKRQPATDHADGSWISDKSTDQPSDEDDDAVPLLHAKRRKSGRPTKSATRRDKAMGDLKRQWDSRHGERTSHCMLGSQRIAKKQAKRQVPVVELVTTPDIVGGPKDEFDVNFDPKGWEVLEDPVSEEETDNEIVTKLSKSNPLQRLKVKQKASSKTTVKNKSALKGFRPKVLQPRLVSSGYTFSKLRCSDGFEGKENTSVGRRMIVLKAVNRKPQRKSQKFQLPTRELQLVSSRVHGVVGETGPSTRGSTRKDVPKHGTSQLPKTKDQDTSLGMLQSSKVTRATTPISNIPEIDAQAKEQTNNRSAAGFSASEAMHQQQEAPSTRPAARRLFSQQAKPSVDKHATNETRKQMQNELEISQRIAAVKIKTSKLRCRSRDSVQEDEVNSDDSFESMVDNENNSEGDETDSDLCIGHSTQALLAEAENDDDSDDESEHDIADGRPRLLSENDLFAATGMNAEQGMLSQQALPMLPQPINNGHPLPRRQPQVRFSGQECAESSHPDSDDSWRPRKPVQSNIRMEVDEDILDSPASVLISQAKRRATSMAHTYNRKQSPASQQILEIAASQITEMGIVPLTSPKTQDSSTIGQLSSKQGTLWRSSSVRAQTSTQGPSLHDLVRQSSVRYGTIPSSGSKRTKSHTPLLKVLPSPQHGRRGSTA